MQNVSPEFRDLQREVIDLRERVAKNEGELTQLNRISKDVTKQTIWQFIAFTLSIGGLLLGVLNYQTSVLTKQMDERTRVLEEQIKGVNQRIDQVEKNMSTRFEDLKQEVRNRK